MNADTSKKLLDALRERTRRNPARHPGLSWNEVERRLSANPKLLKALAAMEETGGEPDVVIFPSSPKEIYLVDCSAESPAGRRSLCYDRAALDARKENRPKGSALGEADAMGIELLDETAYRELQSFGAFDLKTSSWLRTPAEVRELGGALFGDRRYDRVFAYHNGAESYFAARGFRGRLKI